MNMKFDLHTHTTISECSQLSLQDLLVEAGEKGLDGVCITDHDSMAIRHQLREGVQDNGLCVIFGMEYSTTEGDFLLFGPFEELPIGMSAGELLGQVDNAGGVAVAAHPFRAGRLIGEHLIKQGLCRIVEGINGRNQDSENASTVTLQDRYGVNLVGGSDAHTVSELGRIATDFTREIRNRSDLIHALKTSQFIQPCLPTLFQ